MVRALLIALIAGFSGALWGWLFLSRLPGLLGIFDRGAAALLTGALWRMTVQLTFIFGLPLLAFKLVGLLPLRPLELLVWILPAFLVARIAHRVSERRRFQRAREAGLITEDQL